MEKEAGFNFEKLKVYQEALNFVDSAYETISLFPKEERFGLRDQFRRAAISVPLNIAEGYGQSQLQFRRYLNIAKGSVRECFAILDLSKRRNYITIDAENKLKGQCVVLSKMLSGLLNKVK